MSSIRRTTMALTVLAGGFGGGAAAQVDESVVATLPTGSTVLDVVHGVDGNDWLMHVESGAAITSFSVRADGGPGVFSFANVQAGSTGAFDDDGDAAVVGDPTGTFLPGVPTVKTLQNVGGAWLPSFITPLLGHPSDPSLGTGYGGAVAMSGDVLVVGSPGSDQAFIYRDLDPPNGDWVGEATITGDPGSRAGAAVAASDQPGGREVMLVGAPDHGPTDTGRVFIVRYDPSVPGWTVDSIWTATGPTARMGASVDIDGELALAGAPGTDSGALDAGMVFTWLWDDGTLQYQIDGSFPGARDHDALGTAVAVIGTRAAASAPGYDGLSAGTSDPFVIPDRGALQMYSTPVDFSGTEADFLCYTITDLGGKGIPTGHARVFAYDAYDRLMLTSVDDGVDTHVLEYRIEPLAWAWEDLRTSSSGTFGAPTLVGEGSWYDGDPLRLGLYDTLPGTLSYLVVGLAQVDLPFYGGTLVPDFQAPLGTFFPLPTAGFGGWILATSVPSPSGLAPGLELFLQAWVVDPGAVGGFAGSNALKATVP